MPRRYLRTSEKTPISEIFGPTIQGEGEAIGTVTHFIRAAGCDFKCDWCDTKYAWQAKRTMTTEQIVSAVEKLPWTKWVTITGGNPALYDFRPVIDSLHRLGHLIAAETQGSRFSQWFKRVDILTLSPKPPSSKQVSDINILDDIIEKNQSRCVLKVVFFDRKDLAFAKEIHARYQDVPFCLSVGTSTHDGLIPQDLLDTARRLTEMALAEDDLRDTRILPQIHVLYWGRRRGK